MNQVSIYKIGQGRERIIKILLGLQKEFGKNKKIILPNRSLIQSVKESLLKSGSGLIGLEFLTFDDLVNLYSFQETKQNNTILDFALQKRLMDKQDELTTLGQSIGFLETIKVCRTFFDQCIEVGFGQENFKDLPFTYKEDLEKAYLIYQELTEDLKITSIHKSYRLAIKNLKKNIFPKEKIWVIGFSGFRPVENEIITTMIQEGFTFDMHLPFDQKVRSKYFSSTLKELREKGFTLTYVEEQETGDISSLVDGFGEESLINDAKVIFIQSREKSLLAEEIFNKVAKGIEDGFSLEDMCIYTSNKQEAEDLLDLGDRYGIPLANPLNKIRVKRSQLLHNLETLLSYRLEGKVGFVHRIKVENFPLVEQGDRLLSILDKIEFEDYPSLIDQIKNKKTMHLSMEDFRYLKSQEGFMRDDFQAIKDGIFSEYMDYCLDLINGMDEENLMGQDPQIYIHLKEVLEEMEKYKTYIGEISPQNFFSILLDFLEKKEAREQEQIKGLSIIPLQKGVGHKFSWVAFFHLDSNYPKIESDNFLKNKTSLPNLQKLGLFYKEGDRKEEEILVFLQALSYSEKAYLTQAGDPDDLSPIWIQLIRGIRVPKIEEVLSFDKNGYKWTKAHEGRIEGYQKPVQAKLQGEALNHIKDQIKDSSHTASFLESYLYCPFKFYMENFLLDKEEVFDRGREENFAKGNIYHKTLERFYQENRSLEELEEVFSQVCNQVDYRELFDPLEYPLIQKVLLEPLKKMLEEDFERRSDKKKNGGFSPKHLEESFSFELLGIKWRGIIDRIDQNEKGQEILIDYKKNQGASPSDVMDGRSWQLPLYGYARRLQGKDLVGLEYGNIGKGKFGLILRDMDKIGKYPYARTNHLKTDEVEEFFQNLPSRLWDLLKTIEEGNFPPLPSKESNCQYCPYKDMCRKEELDEKRPNR